MGLLWITLWSVKTNFVDAIKSVVLWNRPEAFDHYTRLYIAGFSSILVWRFIGSSVASFGFGEISVVSIGLLIYKKMLPRLNRDSLSVWMLFYGYVSAVLLVFQPVKYGPIKTDDSGK